MEKIRMENVEVDQNRRQLSQHCLGLPTILRKVLEQFPTRQLIGLSLVNKLWNFEARSVMRERGNAVANFLDRGLEVNDQCQRLVALSSDLEKMRVVPLSGLVLFVHHSLECKSNSEGSLDQPYKVILDRMSWKHFAVRFYDRWDICKDCPVVSLVKRILEDYGEMLEELELGFGKEQFLRPIFQDWTLPRLKYLTIESRFGSADDSLTSNFIKALVSSAPNLKKLRVNDVIDLTVNVLEGSSAVLVPKCRFQPLLKPICQGLLGSIRSDFMEIRIHNMGVDPKSLNRFIPKLMEASRSTLRILVIDLLFALPLMCYGILLENVTTLEIHMNRNLLVNIQPSVLALATGLDFNRSFPKLFQVTILDDSDELDLNSDVVEAFIEQGNAVLSRALPDRANNIKCLEIDQCSYSQDFLPLLAQMFPDVETVQRKRQHQELSFAVLREHFLRLERVIESQYGRCF